MKLIPILFSTPMVQAEREGRKTMTRRTRGLDRINISPDDYDFWQFRIDEKGHMRAFFSCGTSDNEDYAIVKCPYGQPGDVLWVRETFRKYWLTHPDTGEPNLEHWNTEYRADNHEQIPMIDGDGFGIYNRDGSEKMIPWKPGIHMPYEACRTWLKIKSIRVERLRDIRRNDAIDEGIQLLLQSGAQLLENGPLYRDYSAPPELFNKGVKSIQSFKSLWQSINGEDSWTANPWVWVVEFERTEKP